MGTNILEDENEAIAGWYDCGELAGQGGLGGRGGTGEGGAAQAPTGPAATGPAVITEVAAPGVKEAVVPRA